MIERSSPEFKRTQVKQPSNSRRNKSLENLDLDLETVYAFLLQLPLCDRQEILRRLQNHLGTVHSAEQLKNQLPDGMRIQNHVGSKEIRSVTKKGKNYIEIWFHWEEPRSTEKGAGREWIHKSRYVCQYPEHGKPKSIAAQKLGILDQQLAQERPYSETLELLGLSAKKAKRRLPNSQKLGTGT
ncbi:hypothetical protein ACQ4M3_05750 [Leptolyngbya sp. AN03gr2]|uniref:hypothetical protein n=1 Tax=unclassified Leptolyngbya TaxID=2650499 RepID=UPI003D31A7F7